MTQASKASKRRHDFRFLSDNQDNGQSDWQLDYLFSIGRASWIIHLSVCVLTFVVLVRRDVGSWSLVWISAMAALSLALACLSHTYAKGWFPRVPRSAFGKAHSAITAAIGLVWGAGAFASAAQGELDLSVLYALALGGTALGAVSSQHALPRSCLLSIWTSVPQLAASFLVYAQNPSMFAIATMVLLYGVTLTILMHRMFDFLSDNVTISRDLSRKNAKLFTTSAQLKEAHDAKLRFLAQASHDLRQPIHAIGLFVECLRGMRLGTDASEILASVDQSVSSLSRLCRSLLDLSAIEAGQVKPEPVDFALNDILGEVVRQSQESARKSSAELRFVSTRNWVHADPALLQAMVQNLVSNAIKYAPNAKLLVGVKRRQGKLALAVVDQGPGIPEERCEKIFAEFERLDVHRGGSIEGLGLGLSIVRRLGHLMDLTVRVQSRVGHGTTFWIEELMPIASRKVAAVKLARDHHRVLEGLRVLVIDDDRAVRKSTAQVLARWGCSSRATGRIDSLRAEVDSTDFILCDQDLGGSTTGLDLVTRLRAATPKIIGAAIMTGSDSEQLRADAARAGIVVLAKPVNPSQLRSLLLSAVSGKNYNSPSSAATRAAADRVETSSERNTAET